MHKSVLLNGLALVSVIGTACLFAGCRPAEFNEPASKPVFFPPPPEVPRLQFLKSISRPEDLGAAATSPLERFVLGDPETTEGITTPYGMAIFEGKLYVCDVGRRMVEVLDLRDHTLGYLTKDRRLMNPVNIYIDDDGSKYVADPTAGLVFVFDRDDNLSAMLGQQSKINPIDVVVRGSLCYVTDFGSNQVVVLDKATGREITRVGKRRLLEGQVTPLTELPPGEFSLISDLALDQQGNIYVTDKSAARITQFDPSGIFSRTIGRLGDNIDEFVRPKGIAIDREGRIWVVDAATEVAKIYNQQAQLLLFFGLPGSEPGMMNLPAKVVLDYDNVELFQRYAVDGASIEFLVLVSNQYGSNKISVYGFGSFPVHGEAIAQGGRPAPATSSESKPKSQVSPPPASASTKPQRSDNDAIEQTKKIAELYNTSMALYRAGQLEKAREGFVQVLNSGLIPGDMAKTIKAYIADIDGTVAKDEREKETAELYYRSMAYYRGGQLAKAREGLIRVLKSGAIPPAMAKTIESHLVDIENSLAGSQSRR